jgi:hypothetical protein
MACIRQSTVVQQHRHSHMHAMCNKPIYTKHALCQGQWLVPAPVQPPPQLRKLLEEVSGPGGAGLEAGITGGYSCVCCHVPATVVLPLALLPPLLLALGVRRVGGVLLLLLLRGAARHDLGKQPRFIPGNQWQRWQRSISAQQPVNMVWMPKAREKSRQSAARCQRHAGAQPLSFLPLPCSRTPIACPVQLKRPADSPHPRPT